jgi:4-methyl-5(b-hydroxyethyl)-thiazole monophosphate biosynthesis
MARVVIVLADGFEEIEAVTPADLLRRAGVEVVMAGLSGPTVVGARGVKVVCDLTLDRVAPGWDMLVLPGGLPGSRLLAASPLVQSALRQTVDSDGWVAAICAAPALVLGAHGWLLGRRYTGYPGTETEVEGAHYLQDPVVVDGKLITSRGVGTAGAFALTLVEVLVGPERSAEVARAVLLA